MMASVIAGGNRDRQSLVLSGVDPETCMIVFQNHWAQVVKILEKHDPLRSGAGFSGGMRFGPVPGDEASAVQNYVEHMLFLLMEEDCGQGGAMGPILEFVVTENVMEQLFLWSLRREFTDDMKVEQLKMYEMLVGQSRQPILHHKPVLRPLMMLLGSCVGAGAPAVEAELVLLLNLLCSILAKDPSILELFFHTSEDQGAANFLIFSLLIPFIHREGRVGQQAREALLFIMALSAENQVVARHIAENTYFCPVLATGLSGLYSSLPTRLAVRSEDWHCLQAEDWQQIPALVQFLHSLEFCNAVIQVAHTSIKNQLVGYIYNGFLVPVLAPALHKLTVEEVMTTTAYLDLFLRSVVEPALLQTFLSFVLLHQHESVHILDTLVSRINTPFQLGTVSLALFRTLIGLNCEDVMLQLVLRYLIPCNHMMLSQRRVLQERDCYSTSAAKILSLTPSCCSPELQLDRILWSKSLEGPLPGHTDTEKLFSDEDGTAFSCVIGAQILKDVTYLQYLHDAHSCIASCVKACRVWSAPYDGVDPPPEHCQGLSLDEGGKHPSRRTQRPRPSSDLGSAGEQVNHLELEWDDSYDAVLPPEEESGPETRPSVPAEPPKHIQEMRKNAIMLIRGSYIEESDFQDDVLVYNLIAQKDTKDVVEPSRPKAQNTAAVKKHQQEEGLAQCQPTQPLSNGLSSPQHHPEVKEQNNNACDHNSKLHVRASQPEDDFMSQYYELIRTLGVNPTSPVKGEGQFRKLVSPAEEDEVDFTSFDIDSPELEKTPSPFGSKNHSGAWSQAVPFTGPFISVLLSRLENMLENSIHVNLLLTGILAQLAAYPQPLLHSYLLNTNIVLQPSVRSVYQVLASVKNQVEQKAAAKKDFPELVRAVQQYLLARDDVLRNRELLLSNGDWLPNGQEDRTLVASRITRNLPPPPKIPPQLCNGVFATALFGEFLKELAAFAQEHSILTHTPQED
ncbi:FHF complex subunit HOOK-interacting protein 1A-like [Conger conger]|uniref:FHF complex subunit HOOK-interacting protein 1A-like n=1 Tax=Conger conger TaxID=82655 RepID=UPI002A5AABE0|nr:FHF complex subunit HOOK-interacting protein 1A-like [Conger conger]